LWFYGNNVTCLSLCIACIIEYILFWPLSGKALWGRCKFIVVCDKEFYAKYNIIVNATNSGRKQPSLHMKMMNWNHSLERGTKVVEKQYNPKAKPSYPHMSSCLMFGTAQLHWARSDAHTLVMGAMSSVLKKIMLVLNSLMTSLMVLWNFIHKNFHEFS
jgi:hypothetical protein